MRMLMGKAAIVVLLASCSTGRPTETAAGASPDGKGPAETRTETQAPDDRAPAPISDPTPGWNELPLLGSRLSVAVPQAWVRLRLSDSDRDREAIFQIPDPADEGTPDSTNIKVSVPQWKDVASGGDAVVARLASEPGGAIMSDKTSAKGRRVVLSRAQQGTTPYLVVDIMSAARDVIVWARAAWPLLEKGSPEWSDTVLKDFKGMAKSITVDGVAAFPESDPTATADSD